jgi:hypothetical protein
LPDPSIGDGVEASEVWNSPEVLQASGGDQGHLGSLENWHSHPAVQAAALFYGDSIEVVAAEMQHAWPELVDIETGPLAPWNEASSHVPQDLITSIVGDAPESNQVRFEARILGESLDSLLDGLDTSRGPGAVDQVRDSISALLQDSRSSFDLFHAELQAAVAYKVQSGQCDRWPYITLESRRSMTDMPGKKKIYALVAATGDGWVVGLDLYKDEFPLLEQALQDWNESAETASDKVKEILQQY